MTIDEQLAYLRKGMAEIIREEDLRERLIAAEKHGRPLRVKAGFDPDRARSAPGPHRAAAQDEALSGPGPHGDLPDRRHDRDDRRSDRPQRDASADDARSRSSATPRPTRRRSSRFSIRKRPRCASTATGWRRCSWRTWSGCARSTPWRGFWSATISRSATRKAWPFRCTSCCIRWRRRTIRWRSNATSRWAAPTRSSTCWWAARFRRTSGSRRRSWRPCRFSKASTASTRCRSRSGTTSASPSRRR